MTKSKYIPQGQVTAYLSSLPEDSRLIIKYLQHLILSIADQIAEHIKWNSLSFYYEGEMKAFDAKEYKSDILVCNLHRGKILLVFPTGAKVTDDLDGKNYPDGRKIISFNSLDEVKTHQSKIVDVVKQWLNLIEK